MAQEVQFQEFIGQTSSRKPEESRFIRYHQEGAVARVTLNRPEHNLLNEPMLREVAAGIEAMGEKDDVKLLVLDSACPVFCGGIDIGEYTTHRVFQMLDAFYAAFTAMFEVGKPVLVVVNGPAVVPPGRFAGRLARPGGKSQAAMEEPLTLAGTMA